jgi:hypothetical protein
MPIVDGPFYGKWNDLPFKKLLPAITVILADL